MIVSTETLKDVLEALLKMPVTIYKSPNCNGFDVRFGRDLRPPPCNYCGHRTFRPEVSKACLMCGGLND